MTLPKGGTTAAVAAIATIVTSRRPLAGARAADETALGWPLSAGGIFPSLPLWAHVARRKADWESTTYAKAKGKGERKAEFTAFSGRPIEPLYTAEDLAGHDPDKDLGYPGQAPYTRGVQPTMYRGRLWTMRQYAGFSTPEESNLRYKMLLSSGAAGLSVAFDLPTQIGMDSDDERALGEVGKVGVAIDSLRDMETLFDGIPLDKVTTSMTINAPAAVLLCMYLAVAERQGVDLRKVSGTIQNDILKEYIARGTYIFPPGPSMRLITDTFAFCAKEVPEWNTISISGYHIREAGSTAAQELAFTLADGIAYVQAAVDAGLKVDDFAPRIAFFFNGHNDFLEEVAKFRAARRLWHRVMTERFHAKDPRSHMLRFHTQTAGSTLTAQQPENNVVRVALQALAAVLGGTQSLHTNSMDEALGLPTEKAARIALRTQQIIAHESGVTNTIDPVGGSFAIERLTNDLEAEATKLIAEIDGMGGMLRAIEKGWVQRQIQEAAYRFQREVEEGGRTVVGVNDFQLEAEAPIDLLKVDDGPEKAQLAKLARLRKERDGKAVAAKLEALRKAAHTKENIVPFILDAVRGYATLGEICNTLRAEWGEYTPRADV